MVNQRGRLYPALADCCHMGHGLRAARSSAFSQEARNLGFSGKYPSFQIVAPGVGALWFFSDMTQADSARPGRTCAPTSGVTGGLRPTWIGTFHLPLGSPVTLGRLHFVFLSLLIVLSHERLKIKSFLIHRACSQHVAKVRGVLPLCPSHPYFPPSSSQLMGNHKKGLGAFQTPRITLYFPPTHAQPAIRAALASSPWPAIPVIGEEPSERGLLARPQMLSSLGSFRARGREGRAP